MTDVDTEFDSFRYGQYSPTNANPGIEKGTYLLANLFKELGLRATFHIQEENDPNQKISNRYPAVIEFLDEEDFEIGLHIHIKSLDKEIRRARIHEGVSGLRALGYRIRSYRAGWYFTSTSTIEALEENDIEFDCSPVKNSRVGPMRWYELPDSPYNPSRHDITRIGKSNVLVIPVTNYRLSVNYWPNSYPERRQAQKAMIEGIRFLGSLSERLSTPVILYITTHSWKPISENGESIREWVEERFRALVDTVSEFEYESNTVADVGDRWKKGGYEPYWYDAPDILGKILPWSSPRKHSRLNRIIGSRLLALNYHLTGKL
ncbi:MAG: hypothetical protein P1Q69_08070 [Candidatus Thorarchaeota archaeon]|nr:hypothetical protein [Candidatus Thorarchaeota archaeon]